MVKKVGFSNYTKRNIESKIYYLKKNFDRNTLPMKYLIMIARIFDKIEKILQWLNDIHLLDRTETNIIFIWSGKVILGEAKPSPNITSPDQINMILGEVLSNKCFIIPAHVVCTRSIARLIDSDQEAIYHVAVRPCKSLRIASFIFERRILLRSNWLRCDEIESVLSQTG